MKCIVPFVCGSLFLFELLRILRHINSLRKSVRKLEPILRKVLTYVLSVIIDSNAVSPSVYLIGDKGSLLEVVSEPLSSFEMKEKLNSAWKRHCSALEANKAAAAAALLASGDQNQSSAVLSDAATAKALLQANEDLRLAENAANESNISVEDKIERAQRLVKAKREQKMAEEAEVNYIDYFNSRFIE
jgi:hypothetical protein